MWLFWSQQYLHVCSIDSVLDLWVISPYRCHNSSVYPDLEIGPVGWGWRKHRLYLSRGARPSTTSVLDMTMKNLMVKFKYGWRFGECKVRLHCHRSRSTLSGVVAPDKGPIDRSNRTKLRSYAELDCLK